MARASNRPTPEPQPLPIQDRPADAPRRSLRAQREEPREREYEVTGPKVVGGKTRGESVTLSLTDEQEHALILAGHVKPAPKADRPPLAANEEG